MCIRDSSKPLSRAALFGTLRALLPNKIMPRQPEQAAPQERAAAPSVQPVPALPPCLDARAVERLNVSPETYQKIVRGYVRNTSEALPALRKGLYLDAADGEPALCRPSWEWIIREAHNLKGASANVGAVAVQQDAHALETAARRAFDRHGPAALQRGELENAFAPLLDALETAFATVRASVLDFLPEVRDEAGPDASLRPGLLDAAQQAQVQHLKDMLALADPDRVAEALAPLSGFLAPALMEQLQGAVDLYDYDEALALLDTPPDMPV